jgi:protein O-mannosyl-transferase
MQTATLFCAALIIFANTFFHPFVHDDIVFIVQNPSIGRFDNLYQAFLGSPDPAAVNINTYYRPLLEVIYRLEHAAFGLNPAGWHVFNALLHGLNGWLVYRLLTLAGFAEIVPWASAMLFIVHPVQTEAVACVAGVSNLVMAFFVLSTLIFYLKDKFLLSTLCFCAGLLSKEQTLMAVPLVVLLDVYRGQKRYKFWALFSGLAVSYLMMRQTLTGAHVISDVLASTGELKLRIKAIGQTLMTYLRILVAPFDLHYYRSTDILKVSNWWWLAVLSFAAALIKSNKVIQWGALWFVLALLPVLNILPLINEYSLILTAEHFLYVPMIGLVAVFVWSIDRWKGNQSTKFLVPLMIVLAILSIKQNTYWASERKVFERTAAFEKDFGRGHFLLAKAYYFEKDYGKADQHFAKSAEIMKGYLQKARGDNPKRFYAGFLKGILFDWAHNFEMQGNFPQAKDKYHEAIALDPRDPVMWNNLGALQIRLNDLEGAKTSFNQALGIDPNFAPARQNLLQLQ